MRRVDPMQSPDSKPNSTRKPASLVVGILNLPKRLAVTMIRLYQKTAPFRPPMCRYQPSCSEYTAQAIQKYGIVAGFALGVRRIIRCNPFTSGGFDPLP